MGDGNAARGGSGPEAFAHSLRAWTSAHGGLICGLSAARDLGDAADPAVEALLELKPVVTLRLSWDLWAALTAGAGGDPEAGLLGHVPLAGLERMSYALWGNDWRALRFLKES